MSETKSDKEKREYKAQWNRRKTRKLNLLGLTKRGTPLTRPKADRGGLSKDHKSYMRWWRKNRDMLHERRLRAVTRYKDHVSR